jgi:diguanylate cyclase (GGDEF)-like protein
MLEVDSFTHFVHFPAEEIETLAAIAKQAAIIIENAGLYEKEQGQRQRAEALVEVLTATASTLSQKKVLIKLCEAVVDISVGERCSIFLLDSERGRLEPVMSLGSRDEKLWQKFRRPPAGVRRAPGEQRFLQAATTWDKPIVAEDAENSPILPHWWVKTFSLKSLVMYPLRVKDRTIGAMTVHTSRDRVHFPQEEIETLAAVANQAAVIIENAHLYEQERQQRQRAEALVNVLSAAASDLSFRRILATISQSVLDFSAGERCSIFLFNEETHTLDPVMAMGPGDPGLFERWRESAGLKIPEIRGIGEAIKAQEPIIEEHAPGSGVVPDHWIKAFRLKSVALYPLVHREKTVGVLVVNTFTDFTHFPQDEIETLAAVAKQAAIIIENARLHERLQEQAITDPVTSLYNHRHIHQRLDEEIARASRTGKPFAVMMIDLDRFKLFNDTYGHPRGDEALRFVAGQLRAALRTSDTIGRYGGDEFLAVLPDATREDAQDTGKRIIAVLADQPFVADCSEQSVPLAISIGIAYYPDDGTTKDDLVALADAALYEAKRLGGNRAVAASVGPPKRASSLKKVSA